MENNEVFGPLTVSRWLPFRQVSTLAYYDTTRQVIHLCQSGRSEVDAALARVDCEARLKVLPYLLHETRHWFDHIGTLWGLENLVAYFNAVHAQQRNDPSGFAAIVAYHRLAGREGFPSYYSTVGSTAPASSAERRWAHTLSSGLRFDLNGKLDESAPIFFTRFSWLDGTDACRVPFSIAALLEAAAMDIEFATLQSVVLEMPSSRQRDVEREIDLKTMCELYDPELGLYSNGVHLLANLLGLSSVAEAFPYAGILASLCLNLPRTAFQSLQVPVQFAAWGARNAAAIRRRERGYAYLVIAHHGSRCERTSAREWVESAAEAAGLPKLSVLEQQIADEREALVDQCDDGAFRSQFDALASAGSAFTREVGCFPTAGDILERWIFLPLPPVICSNGMVRLIGSTPLFGSTNEFIEWEREIRQHNERMSEFVDACWF